MQEHGFKPTILLSNVGNVVNILIHERTQHENESFQTYFTQMELLFQKLSVEMNDKDKIEILKHNMLTTINECRFLLHQKT